MLESQRVLFVLRGSLARRYSTGISWSPDRQRSKIRTSLRRSRLDGLRLEEMNEARFLLEYRVRRLHYPLVVQILQSSLQRLGSSFPRVQRECGASRLLPGPLDLSLHELFSSRNRPLRPLAMLGAARPPRTLYR